MRTTTFTHYVLGEPFVAEATKRGIWLVHPRWSLMGRGDDMLWAEANLAQEASEIAPVYRSIPIEERSKDASDMLAFCERLSLRRTAP